MRVTIPHVFDFGADRELVGDDLVRPEAWDALRVGTDGPFSVAADRATLERQAEERTDLQERARALGKVLDAHGARRVVSYGAGSAVLELCLHRLDPDRRLVLTDYAPATVERVAALLPELEVRRHDLLADRPLDADLHLFHRIDTEFTNAQWRGILDRFAGVPILVVATEVIGIRRARDETLKRLLNRRATRAGWARNRAAFEALWRAHHDAERLRIADLEGWFLRPRGLS